MSIDCHLQRYDEYHQEMIKSITKKILVKNYYSTTFLYHGIEMGDNSIGITTKYGRKWHGTDDFARTDENKQRQDRTSNRTQKGIQY